MNKCLLRNSIALLALAGMTFGLATPSEASIVPYIIPAAAEISGSGGVMPGDAVATFDDGGTPGSVTLTLDLTDWTGGVGAGSAFAREWYFQTATDLSLATFSFSGPVGTLAIDLSAGAFDGQGTIFDWSVQFPTSGNENRFTAGEIVALTITLSGITAGTFAPGLTDPYGSGLRAQGLGGDGQNSGWFAGSVPEPASFVVWFLVGLSWAGSAWTHRYRRRWQKWQQEEAAAGVRRQGHADIENQLGLREAAVRATRGRAQRSER